MVRPPFSSALSISLAIHFMVYWTLSQMLNPSPQWSKLKHSIIVELVSLPQAQASPLPHKDIKKEIRKNIEKNISNIDERTLTQPQRHAGKYAERQGHSLRWIQRVHEHLQETVAETFRKSPIPGSSGRRVVLRLTVMADGTLEKVTLDETSGSPAVDQLALYATRKIDTFASPGKDVAFRLPLRVR